MLRPLLHPGLSAATQPDPRFTRLEYAIARSQEPRAEMIRDVSFQGVLYRKGEIVKGMLARHFAMRGVAR